MKKILSFMLLGMITMATVSMQQAFAGKAQDPPAAFAIVVFKLHIKGDKVVKIEAIRNQETPKYFARIKSEVLGKWDGKKVAKAAKMKVDGVTGATLSSDAVKENVKRGLKHYQDHK